MRPTARALKERISRIKEFGRVAGPGGLASTTAMASNQRQSEPNPGKRKERATGSQDSPGKHKRAITPSAKKDESDQAVDSENCQPDSEF